MSNNFFEIEFLKAYVPWLKMNCNITQYFWYLYISLEVDPGRIIGKILPLELWVCIDCNALTECTTRPDDLFFLFFFIYYPSLG